MDKNDILDYVTETPGNTNRAVLGDMLDSFAGGGGGSSDFSTAKLTLTNPSDYTLMVPVSIESGGMSASMGFVNSSGTFDVILYKGMAVLVDNNNLTLQLSGNIEIMVQNFMYTITGDCTITIS